MNDNITVGEYRAKALTGAMTMTKGGGDQVTVNFQILDVFNGPDLVGQRFVWNGSLSEKAMDRTLDGLCVAGWTGSDFANLPGLGTTECKVTIEDSEYNGKVNRRISWVNGLDDVPAFMNPVSAKQAQDFEARNRSRIQAAAAKRAPSPRGPQPSNGHDRRPPPPAQASYASQDNVPF